MKRRTFLKIAGLGGASLTAGCFSEPEKSLFSLVQAPDDMVTGKATWYASTCRECPAGCGILAKNREGRVVKIEGNPNHPVNRGKICIRGQAALQGIYNPDRLRTPLLKENDRWRPISFDDARKLLREKGEAAGRRGRNRVGMLTEMAGESLQSLFNRTLAEWNSPPALIFEPFSYESLKAANRRILGVDGLVSYRMERSDFLVSFGADFLETWLSPVEYGIKFKQMHALKEGRKSLFYHISPYQSLTGANADVWLSCIPGSEAALALSLVHECMQQGQGIALPEDIRKAIRRAALPFTKEKASQLAGIPLPDYLRLLKHLMAAHRPLILGTGTGTTNALQADMAANMLNLVLDPNLELFDFNQRHAIEAAVGRSAVAAFLKTAAAGKIDLLLLNNVNPVYALPPESGARRILERDSLFVVSFSSFMDETSQSSDLIFPIRLPLETWDDYSGKRGIVSTLQPAMGKLTDAPHIGDVFLETAPREVGRSPSAADYPAYLYSAWVEKGHVQNAHDWALALQAGGVFDSLSRTQAAGPSLGAPLPEDFSDPAAAESEMTFVAAPSLRFFDGRGANKPWLCEIPEVMSQVAWQTPVRVHPDTLARYAVRQGEEIRIESRWGSLEAPVYETRSVKPGVLVMEIGQGHAAYGRYARGVGRNPFEILPFSPDPSADGPLFTAAAVTIKRTGRRRRLAHLDGSPFQFGRKIALSITLPELADPKPVEKTGLSMSDFPFTLPLPEGYSPRRDIYPAHDHAQYRWSMAVDLDRCIGCNACAAACYAENNLGVVGEERILEGREMAWLQVQRYLDTPRSSRTTFLPMLCQHCDNAPCESVCPVYAPHHNPEGLNNQIYNRCIGTRFCSQNCPYKVRRFNWFDWQWPKPLHLQLNPDVTVRSKGVMEKCSFCIQRIKDAHNAAKNENRKIRDGEVTPACVQTCPTDALVFGNLMDPDSRVRRLAADRRAYQVMGYLNTKPAVIYLKKVLAKI